MHFKWIDKFDLFLLDFDGLLVDTERLHYAAYQRMCKNRGFLLPWDFNRYCEIAHYDGGIAPVLYAEIPKLHTLQPDWSVLYAEKKQAYMDILKEGKISLLPGVEEFLKVLSIRKIKRCVVTNSWEEQIKWIRAALPILNTIPVWITREQYEKAKPAPDGYLKAIDLLADHSDRIVGFEDTFRGIQALKETRAEPILICSDKHPQLKEAGLKGISRFTSFEHIKLG
jgi:HAD superfamily hydrolase (TIGR01509 family)